MSGYDEGSVTVSGGGGIGGNKKNGISIADNGVKELFKKFIKEWKNQENIFIYKEQLRQHYNLGWHYIEINIDHLTDFDQELSGRLVSSPNELIPSFEDSIKDIIREMNFNKDVVREDIQILFKNSANPEPIRFLRAGLISKLVKVQGIVISASRTQPKPATMAVKCKNCEHAQILTIRPGIVSSVLPQQCERGSNSAGKPCPNNPYVVLSDQSTFVNQQILKLQESPETIPTGEMPRHILLSLDRSLADKITPGTRIKVLGVLGIFEGGGGGGRRKEMAGTIRTNYLRVLGITSDNAGRDSMYFTPSEEQSFRVFSRRTDLRDIIAKSIAPSIYGHEDIKRAISCQLFGGAPKRLPDKMRLRGDINLLLLGDPGTAKSQLLKFVEKVAPISVYTSGKGSSAAGLTASVIREPATGEYYLEGGAMVVADGGVVCIDEFDKMNVDDRVAIHEAMEQQTISIAKAGITTILNSRTSVLAAANPVYGRYNDMADDNIDFQSTILSRFDLIFIVKDPKNEKRDFVISTHVVNIHQKASRTSNENNNDTYDLSNTVVDDSHITENEVSIQYLKKYIAYCRSRISPRLSEDAVTTLKNHYVSVRAKSKEQEIGNSYGKDGNSKPKKKKNAIPITVRQLEAIIRISESLAKMSLSSIATNEHAKEAIRLFDISTFDAITTNNTVNETLTPERLEMIQTAEKFIKNRVPIGTSIRVKTIKFELSRSAEMDNFAILKALDVLVGRDEFEYRNQKKSLYRKQ